VIASPAEGETLFTSPLYPLLRTAIEFQVETRLQDSGERVNLAALADGGSLELTLELLDETGTPVATGIALAPGSEEGVYMTTVRELEPAAYRAQVQVAGEVRRPYLLNSAARVRSIRFEQAVNPRAYVIWGGVGVAAVVSAGTSLYSLRRRMVRRAHPARGKIILVESLDYGDTENRLHTINLDAYNSNTISLGRRQLPRDVMRRTGITRITIVCPDEQAAQARRVQVTVKCGSETVLENRSLSPGGSLTVSSKRGIKTLEEGTSLQLYKDIGDLDSMGSSGVEYFLA